MSQEGWQRVRSEVERIVEAARLAERRAIEAHGYAVCVDACVCVHGAIIADADMCVAVMDDQYQDACERRHRRDMGAINAVIALLRWVDVKEVA